jgi:amino-acid N-acetyltransferase
MESASFCIRPANLDDVPPLVAMINAFAARQLMLSRNNGELYETIRDFQVAEADGSIVGCVATHVVNRRIAEVKSLAVDPAVQGRGIGARLVSASVTEAQRLGLEKVFALTYQVAFFERQGFVRVDRAHLPEKVWGECVRCDRFLSCDEVAMWREVQSVAAAPLPAT